MENKPTHIAYAITQREEDNGEERRDFWTKIGAAWMHSDGKGYSLTVDALPMNGRIVLREREERENKEPAE